MDRFKPKWHPIETAPAVDEIRDRYREIWVYQPAVEYSDGQRFDAYLTRATPWLNGKWYSEECNACLDPTHWCEFRIEPPNQIVIKSPHTVISTWTNVSSG